MVELEESSEEEVNLIDARFEMRTALCMEYPLHIYRQNVAAQLKTDECP